MRARIYLHGGTSAGRIALTLALMLTALAHASPVQASVPLTCLVDASAAPGGGGSTWASAYADLQTALTTPACVEIWVKSGVYKPTSGVDRAASFVINSDVEVYGGFNGTESLRTERNPATNVTILSGDIDNNDTDTDGNHIDETTLDIQLNNSYNVVSLNGTGASVTATTVLDGFTITGGKATNNLLIYQYIGGGLVCNGNAAAHECSPTLVNLAFKGNYSGGGGGAMAAYGAFGTSSPTLTGVSFSGNDSVIGGAIYNHAAQGVTSPTLTNVTFTGNSATTGGAVYNYATTDGTAQPTFTNATFSDNSAISVGGAIYSYASGTDATSTAAFTNATFSNNSSNSGGAVYNYSSAGGTSSPSFSTATFDGNDASGSGGAVQNYAWGGTSSPTFVDVVFSQNTSLADGGAIYNSAGNGGTSSPSFTDVTFDTNTANFGGAIFDYASNGTSSPTLKRVTFKGNNANDNGGAINNTSFSGGTSSPTLSNVTFSDNGALLGGAFYNGAYNASASSSPTLINVTFNANHATTGGAFENVSSNDGLANPTLTNVILWGDTATFSPEIYNGPAAPSISYSVVQGSGGSDAWVSTFGSDGGHNLDADPKLAALADNGGYTETLALQLGSSATDAGNDTACADASTVNAKDQRDVTRPQGAHCDIGAFEADTVGLSGNVGIAGVTLAYMDGTPKTVTTDGTGSYSIVVDYGWSGTVVPFKPGYGFSPASTSYSNLQAYAPAQDYVASGKPTGGTYDDADGSWTHIGAWVDISVPGPHDNTLGVLASVGSTASFEFYGKGFSLSYLRYAGFGSIAVYVDGSPTPLTTINTNGPTALLTYNGPGLYPGPHVLTLRHAGPAGSFVAFDSLTIETQGPVASGDWDAGAVYWSPTGTWAQIPVTGLYANSLSVGVAPSSTSTLFFAGSGFTLTYLRYPGWGHISIYLDGLPAPLTTIDTNGIAALNTYTSPPLTPGAHFVTVVHAGPPGTFIGLDEIQIAP